MSETAATIEPPKPRIERKKPEKTPTQISPSTNYERRSLANLRPKTPDQLLRQTGQVGSITQGSYRRYTEDVPESTKDPRNFIQKVKAGIAKREQGVWPEEFEERRYYFAASDYNEYVEGLRELRRKQRKDLRKRRVKLTSADQMIDEFNFTRGMAYDVFRAIHVDLDSNPAVKKAIESPSEFKRIIRQRLESYPADIAAKSGNYNDLVLNTVALFLTRDEIRNIILEGGTDARIIRQFKSIAEYLKPGDKEQIVEDFMGSKHDASEEIYLLQNPELKELFPKDEIKNMVVRAIKTSEKLPFFMETFSELVDEGILSREDVVDATVSRINAWQTMPIKWDKQFEDLVAWLNSEESRKVVDSILSTGAHMLSDKIDLLYALAQKNPDQMEAVNKTVANQVKGYGILPEATLESLFRVNASSEVRKIIVESAIDQKQFYILFEHFPANEYPARPTQVRALVDLVIDRWGLSAAIKEMHLWGGSVGDDYLKKIVEKAKTYEEKGELLRQLPSWRRLTILNRQFVKDYLLEEAKSHVSDILYSFREAVEIIGEDQRDEFQRDLAKGNAFLLLLEKIDEQSRYEDDRYVSLSAQEIVDIGLGDTNTLDFAPKTIAYIYKKLASAKSDQERKSLLTEGERIYAAIEVIKNAGLEEQLKSIYKSSQINARDEKELLSAFSVISKLKLSEPERFDGIESFGKDLSEIRLFLFRELTKDLGLADISLEQQERFLSTMGSVVPFFTYLEQYKNEPEYKEQLREIFKSIADGKFADWKYGGFTPDSLTELLESGHLPNKLTYEQYKTWRIDEQTSLVDTVSADANQTASQIKDYLEANIDHLEVETVMDKAREEGRGDISAGVQILLGKTGKELADINIKLRDARASGQSDLIQKLESAKLEVESQRSQLLRVRTMSKLIDLSAAEIASGFFINEGKEGKNRGLSISATISELKSTSDPDNRFIYETIETMIANAASLTGEKEDLVAVDSSDPRIWMEIGENPVASCQNYNEGSMNECLLGYTNPNTKILALYRGGKLVARSILRLGSFGRGEPALHVERIYTAYPGEGITRAIYSRAKRKAEEMGVPVFISRVSQTEEGDMEEAKSVKGFTLQRSKGRLYFNKSRAPAIYVDAAGGKVTSGFSIGNLLEIQ